MILSATQLGVAVILLAAIGLIVFCVRPDARPRAILGAVALAYAPVAAGAAFAVTGLAVAIVEKNAWPDALFADFGPPRHERWMSLATAYGARDPDGFRALIRSYRIEIEQGQLHAAVRAAPAEAIMALAQATARYAQLRAMAGDPACATRASAPPSDRRAAGAFDQLQAARRAVLKHESGESVTMDRAAAAARFQQAVDAAVDSFPLAEAIAALAGRTDADRQNILTCMIMPGAVDRLAAVAENDPAAPPALRLFLLPE